MPTTVMQVRVDEELKKQAAAVCEELGLDLPTAIRMFMKRTVLQNGIPFSMTLPKANGSDDILAEESITTGMKQGEK